MTDNPLYRLLSDPSNNSPGRSGMNFITNSDNRGRASHRSPHADGDVVTAQDTYLSKKIAQEKDKQLAAQGSVGADGKKDTELAIIGTKTAKAMDQAIHGGKKRINPKTGLREYAGEDKSIGWYKRYMSTCIGGLSKKEIKKKDDAAREKMQNATDFSTPTNNLDNDLSNNNYENQRYGRKQKGKTCQHEAGAQHILHDKDLRKYPSGIAIYKHIKDDLDQDPDKMPGKSLMQYRQKKNPNQKSLDYDRLVSKDESPNISSKQVLEDATGVDEWFGFNMQDRFKNIKGYGNLSNRKKQIKQTELITKHLADMQEKQKLSLFSNAPFYYKHLQNELQKPKDQQDLTNHRHVGNIFNYHDNSQFSDNYNIPGTKKKRKNSFMFDDSNRMTPENMIHTKGGKVYDKEDYYRYKKSKYDSDLYQKLQAERKIKNNTKKVEELERLLMDFDGQIDEPILMDKPEPKFVLHGERSKVWTPNFDRYYKRKGEEQI